MSTSPKALVEAPVLAWMRNSAGFSIDELAHKIGTSPDVIHSWETGEEQPSMAQVRKLALAYKRPISDLFLLTPPQAQLLPHDFRRTSDLIGQRYSPQLRHELRASARRRQLALDLIEESQEAPPAPIPLRITQAQDPESIGLAIRTLLRITTTEQKAWRGDPRKAYKSWRTRVESLGILVFQITSVARDEMHGFCIATQPLPVIAINRKLKPNGRTFTMLHELAHILLGEAALCDIDESAHRNPIEQRTEVFCNHVAGATLVPASDLLAEAPVVRRPQACEDWTDDELASLAKTYSVSEEVLLRRLLTLKRTTRAFYAIKRAEYVKRYALLERNERDAQQATEVKRNMPREKLSDLGHRFTGLVLSTYHADRISLADASEYLGLRAKNISKIDSLLMESA